jgi:YD repeat-containing protein
MKKSLIILITQIVLIGPALAHADREQPTPIIDAANSCTSYNCDGVYKIGDMIRINVYGKRGVSSDIVGGTLRIISKSQGYDSAVQKLTRAKGGSWFYHWDTSGLNAADDYQVNFRLIDRRGRSSPADATSRLYITLTTKPPIRGDLVSVTDVNFPALGPDTTLVRTYQLYSGYNGCLGYGWTHSYNMRLSESEDGLVRLFDADGTEAFFKPTSGGGYSSPIGDYRKLTKYTNGFSLREKSGKLFYFDATGRLTKIVDRNHNRVRLHYNARGLLKTVVDASQQVISFIYDSTNRIASIVDPTGRFILYNYDKNGNLISLSKSWGYQGYKTKYGYDLQHRLTVIAYPNSTYKFFEYGVGGRVVSVYNEKQQNRLDVRYNLFKPQLMFYDAGGGWFFLTYNEFSSILNIRDLFGNEINYTYDEQQNLTSITNNQGLKLSFAYDDRGNLTRLVDSSGDITILTYDNNYNQLHSFTDTKGNVVRFKYDDRGNLVQAVYPNKLYETFKYSPRGNLIEKVDRKKQRVVFEYNHQGKLISQRHADSLVTFNYDRAGNLIRATNSIARISFTYDSLNHLTKTSYLNDNGRLYEISYEYDQLGNRTKTVYPDGYQLNYHYDEANRLAYITDSARELQKYCYDKMGRRLNKQILKQVYSPFEDNSGGLLNLICLKTVARISSIYNNDHRYHDNLFVSTTVVDFENYIYEPVNQLLNIPRLALYLFDDLPAMLDIQIGGKQQANQFAGGEDEKYEYDANGNIINKITKAGITNFAYDYENRLIRMQRANKAINYAYDPLGRVIKKRAGNKAKEYIYDGMQVIMETDDHNNTVATYVYGPMVDEVLRMWRNNTEQFYTEDGLGSSIVPY